MSWRGEDGVTAERSDPGVDERQVEPGSGWTSSTDAARLASQAAMLDRLVNGETLPDILSEVVRQIERLAPEMIGSILLLDDTGTRLLHGASPSLSPGFGGLDRGLDIGPSIGSSGTAAYLGEQVIVTDIATDERWVVFREEALRVGLAACWSTPIRAQDGSLLGTFALYSHVPAAPSPIHLELIDLATSLSSVAIERSRRSQAAFERASLLDHSRDLVGLADLDGRVLYLNPSGRDLAGVGAVEEIPYLADLYDDATAARLLGEAIPAAIESGTWMGPGHISHRSTGNLIDVDISLFTIRDAETGLAVRLGTIQRDTRARRRAQQLESRFAALVRSSPDGIFGLDGDALITSWNPACERIFGYTPGEAIGQHLRLLVPEDAIHDHLSNLRHAMGGEAFGDRVVRRRAKDGSDVFLSATVSPVRNELGAVEGLAVIVHELGERENRERERGIAETFQRSLLPTAFDVPGRHLTAVYLPASGTLGGDWYDVILVDDRRVVFVIADVVGHDLEAAVKMMQLRNATRVYSLDGVEPAEMLIRLNRFALDAERNGAGAMFCTMIVASLDTVTNRLTYANAGHPPALVVHHDGTSDFLESAGAMPISVLDEVGYRQAALDLDPTDTVIFYTDGLVESRTLSLDRGLELLRAAAGSTNDPELLAKAFSAGLDPTNHAPVDDTAFMIVAPSPRA